MYASYTDIDIITLGGCIHRYMYTGHCCLRLLAGGRAGDWHAHMHEEAFKLWLATSYLEPAALWHSGTLTAGRGGEETEFHGTAASTRQSI